MQPYCLCRQIVRLQERQIEESIAKLFRVEIVELRRLAPKLPNRRYTNLCICWEYGQRLETGPVESAVLLELLKAYLDGFGHRFVAGFRVAAIESKQALPVEFCPYFSQYVRKRLMTAAHAVKKD